MSADAIACFGEILLRLSPQGGTPLRTAAALDLHVGGAEANVAVGLACLGWPTRMISSLPDDALGERARGALVAHGVATRHVGTREGRMGVYYFTPPAGPRPAKVLYDRDHSAFAGAGADAYDPDRALEGCRHLHVSGISLALGEASTAATFALLDAARAKGLSVSFDGNFRPALWAKSDRDPRVIVARAVSATDLFFGNHKDVSLLLGATFSGDGEERRREAALAALEAFPNLAGIVSTARHVLDGAIHSLVGRYDTREMAIASRERRLSGIVDRIGTGDAFAAGFLDGWLSSPNDGRRALESGMALAAIKHFTPGDFSTSDRSELEAALGEAADVSR